MKFDSPIFDRIRVKPDKDRRLRAASPTCEWAGCEGAGTHRAPKGRSQEREYWKFCLQHVREYNQSYNFFAGMSTDAVASYQKDALTGHRPTWKLGMVGGKRAGKGKARPDHHFTEQAEDPFDLFNGGGGSRTEQQAKTDPERRAVRNAERKALHALGLEIDASKVEIKAKFKELVKRHHPDANGGDRAFEDKLREIIEAYNYLKSVGYV
jgi:hypothetical protein